MPRRAPEEKPAVAQHHVAFLRAINLGGHNRIAMGALRALLESLDLRDVETYVQSGNAVFRSAQAAPALGRAIEAGITEQFGLRVTVILRTGRELRKIVRANPFLAAGRDPGGLHLTLLAGPPDPAVDRTLEPEAAGPDEFRIAGSDVYLSCPGGYGRTKLTNAWFERRLRVEATTRNWRTITTLAEMAS